MHRCANTISRFSYTTYLTLLISLANPIADVGKNTMTTAAGGPWIGDDSGEEPWPWYPGGEHDKAAIEVAWPSCDGGINAFASVSPRLS
jgi:hypothetical protein